MLCECISIQIMWLDTNQGLLPISISEFFCKENQNEESFSDPIPALLFCNTKEILLLNTYAHQK